MIKLAGFLGLVIILVMTALVWASELESPTALYAAHGSIGFLFALAFWKWMPLGIHEKQIPTPPEDRPKLALLIVPGFLLALGLIAYGLGWADPFSVFLGVSFLVISILWIASVTTDREVI